MYCGNCGKEIAAAARACPFCGQPHIPKGISPKNQLTALLLCIFVGFWGIHRFYAGRTTTAVLMLLTFGCLGVWNLIDLIIIASGNFRDREGNLITQ